MNREQRRRAEREHKGGGSSPDPTTVAMGRAFVQGTIFAAGAAGLSPHQAAEAGLELPVFCVLYDPQRTYAVVPRLRDLLDMQARLGAEELARRVQGQLSWQVLDQPEQPLAKVTFRLVEPVELEATFLLLAGNYAELLPTLMGPHLLALRPAPGAGDPAASDLHALIDGAVLMNGVPSKAVASLVKGRTAPAAPAPLLVVNGGGMDEQMIAQLRELQDQGAVQYLDAEHDGEATYTCLLGDGWPGLHWTSPNHDIYYKDFLGKGLCPTPSDPATEVPEAAGWKLILRDDDFELIDPSGVMALSGPLDDPGMIAWGAAVARSGYVAAFYGPTIEPDPSQALTGMVRELDDLRTPAMRRRAETQLQQALVSRQVTDQGGQVEGDIPSPARRPWWRRLLGLS